MSAEVLREAAASMRERAEAATPGPWVVGDTSAIAGVLNPETDTCAYCRHDSKPSWVGQRDINGRRMRAHVHRKSEPWDGEVYASRADGDIRVTTGTDEYGYIEPTDATHIASWHTAVALAVADWLDGVAERHGPVDNAWNVGQPCCQTCNLDLEGDERGHCDDLDDALAVATAYLGGRP